MPIYSAKPPPQNQNYYVFTGGEPEGPYDLPFVEAMVMSALLAPDVSVSKDGKTGWQPLTALVPPPTPKQPFPPSGRNKAPPPFQAPPPKKENHVGRWVLGIIAVLGVIGYANSGTTTRQSTYQTPEPADDQPSPLPMASPPDTSAPYQAPASTPPPALAPPAGTEQPVYTPPAPIAPAPDPTYTVLDSSGRTFRVSRADYTILGQKEDEMKRVMANINRLKGSRAEESRLIESDRAALDNTDQGEVDRFNAEVDQYNSSGTNLDSLIDSYNSLVQDHNDYLVKVGTPSN